jgi:hypothetical protein
VRVVHVRGVQSHLIMEPAEPIEQAISAPLPSGRDQRLVRYTLPLFPYVFRINLFITLDSMLQKKSTGVEPHYLDIWLPAHADDEAMIEKLVSNNIKCYA